MKYGFGVDLGGTTVKIAYFDREGTLLEKWEIPTDTAENGSKILPDIACSIQAFLKERSVDKNSLLGIGIGVPGPVNDAGVVNRCVNLGWESFNIQKTLEELTGLPVKAGNDANMAALGEAWKGGGQGCENMVFITLGTGVGGGIILHGRPISGVHGAGGEIGHMTVNPREQELCGCGKSGCVEQYCSATGVVRMAKKQLDSLDESSLLRSIPTLSCKDVFDAANAGDALAIRVLDRVYDYMGQFIASVCCVTDPETVVLGGGVSKAGKPLLDGARRSFEKYCFHGTKSVRFALASLGNDAGAYGAFKSVLDAVTL